MTSSQGRHDYEHGGEKKKLSVMNSKLPILTPNERKLSLENTAFTSMP